MFSPLRLVPIVLIGVLAACQSTSTDEPIGASEQHAVVSEVQADRAYEIVRGIDYLPWSYQADGCYARALYMSMELAAERIPSSSQYIYATNGGALEPSKEVAYAWHVAPMIKITATGTPMILDPSLFTGPEVAHSLDAWVARNHPTPAKDYALALMEGSKYYAIYELQDAEPIGNFAELDPFHGADIEDACTVARKYLDAAKRPALVARTKALITSLRTVGKLSDLTADALRCP